MEHNKNEETIFKNTVGRPTNEIKRRRRIFFASVILLVMLSIVGTVFISNSVSKTKWVTTKLMASAGHEVSIKKFSSSTLVIGKTTDKFKVSLSDTDDKANVESSDASIIEIVKYGDNEWALDVKKAGRVTISAEAYREVNGKKKVYGTAKYTYTVKAHALSVKKFNSSTLVIGKRTNKFKINDSSPDDMVDLISDKPAIIQVKKYGDNTTTGNLWALKVKKIGSVTITAQAYKIENGKKKIYSSVKYTYMVKAHSISLTGIDSSSLVAGKVSKPFKINVSSPEDSVDIASSNSSVAQVRMYGDTTASGNLWALNVKKPGKFTLKVQAYKNINGDKKIYNIASYSYEVVGTSSNPTKISNLDLYCVYNMKDITKIDINKEFKCYTSRKSGVRLFATTLGLAKGYKNEYVTANDDNMIVLKYTTAGTKLITASDGKNNASIKIEVTDDNTN